MNRVYPHKVVDANPACKQTRRALSDRDFGDAITQILKLLRSKALAAPELDEIQLRSTLLFLEDEAVEIVRRTTGVTYYVPAPDPIRADPRFVA